MRYFKQSKDKKGLRASVHRKNKSLIHIVLEKSCRSIGFLLRTVQQTLVNNRIIQIQIYVFVHRSASKYNRQSSYVLSAYVHRNTFKYIQYEENNKF